MYLWRKRAGRSWMRANEDALQDRFGPRLALIELPRHKRMIVEVFCRQRGDAQSLFMRFGGSVKSIAQNWSDPYAAVSSKPIKIGRRLIITNVKGTSAPRSSEDNSHPRIHANLPRALLIPAGAAFGTGEHATTAMCLRLLEHRTRDLRGGWSLFDCGTGSGVLALAAHCLGAGKIVAIDSDPSAISTAKQNARSNRIRGLQFQIADIMKWRARGQFDFITANLFSQLLIQALPTFARNLEFDGHLIISGVLREQERSVVRALHDHGLTTQEIRRRGKWIALCARK